MEAKDTHESLEEILVASQQHLQLAVHRVGSEVDVCYLWLPSEVNVAQGNQSRKLHGMAHHK